MALTATRTTQGFELVRNLLGFAPNAVPYELTPSEAFVTGDMVVLTNGKVTKAAAGATNVLGVMAETVTADATDVTKGLVHDNPFNVYRCTFAGHRDAAATGGTTTTLLDTALSTSTDNVWRSGLVYVYTGPGAGSIRTISAYTGASDTLTVIDPFPAAPTTASSYILLGAGGAANDAINVGKIGVDLTDANTINGAGTTVSEAGPLVVTAIDPANLMMDVLIRKHLYNTV